MNWFDFLRNINIGNSETPQIQGVYQDIPTQSDSWNNTMAQRMESGNVKDIDSMNVFNRLKDKVNLFDKYENPTNETNTVTTDENGDTVLNSTVGSPVLTQRGFLNDFTRGARENYNNKFNLQNWRDNENKGFGTRLGEAVGTFGRVLNSPLGRGLLTAGIVKATGGSGLEALAYGGQAGALNQQNVMNDKMYRNALKDYGYDTDDIRGYIDKDAFNTIANNVYKNNALEVRQAIAGQTDNTKRANMIMNGLKSGMITPQEAQTLMSNYGITINDLQASNETQLLPYRQYAMQVAPQIALGNLGVAQGNLALNNAKFAAAMEDKLNPKPDKKTIAALNENNQTLSDIDAGLKLIDENPQAYTWLKGKVGSDIANRIDPAGVPARTQIDNITAVYRKWLTGAQMSDQERKAYERFLPAPTDNAQIVKAKLIGMKNSIERKNNILLNNANMGGGATNKDPLGIL